MNAYRILLLALLTPFFQAVSAQNPGYTELNALASRLALSNDESPEVFLHIDKAVQAAGGTLWCKAYLYQKSNHIPYTKPCIVYIELYDPHDSLIHQSLLESGDLRLEAAIPIPHTASAGFYTIKAYTKTVLEKNAGGVFSFPVYITNVQAASVPPATGKPCFPYTTTLPDQDEVRLIPEGNWLINGIDNKVAVLAFDKQGRPLKITGTVKDNRDSIVANFQTSSSGTALFTFQPVKTRKYKALLTKEGQAWKEINLAEAPVNAYQLALTKEDNSNLYFRVGLSDLLYTKNPVSYIIGISNGRICFSAFGKGMYAVTVPKKNFPAGVASFYLFDDKQQLVSLRKIQTGLPDATVTLEADKKEYMSRATVKLNISVRDTAGKPVSALLSVAVTDQTNVPDELIPSFDTWVSNREYRILPLQNDPTYSIDPFSKEVALIADNAPLSIPAEGFKDTSAISLPGIIIRGRLTNEKKEPVAHQPLSLFSETQRNILLFDTTDANGHFEFKPARFFDSTQFILYADTKNQAVADWKIELEKSGSLLKEGAHAGTYCSTTSDFSKNIQVFTKNYADSFLTSNMRIWLQEITVRANSKKKGAGFNAERNRFSRMITREQLSKLNLSSTVNAVKMVPGVVMIGGKLTIRGGMQGIDNSAGRDIEPLLIVDGVQARMPNGIEEYLNSIPPDNIDYIEVLVGPEAALYATRGANGVIIVKTGLPGEIKGRQPNMKPFYPKGFHDAPDFYMPSYDVEAVRDAAFTDNRSTIYWNGHLQTDEKGKVNLQFYSADARTTYLITLTGLTSKGEIIHQQITVKRN